MFARIRYLLAAFDRGEFDVSGLVTRLDQYVAASSRARGCSRQPTQQGLAPVRIEAAP